MILAGPFTQVVLAGGEAPPAVGHAAAGMAARGLAKRGFSAGLGDERARVGGRRSLRLVGQLWAGVRSCGALTRAEKCGPVSLWRWKPSIPAEGREARDRAESVRAAAR